MINTCYQCHKGPLKGKTVVRKGLAKQKGGTGSKVVRWTKRKFLPNLQKIRIVAGGKIKTVFVCAKCLKKGTIIKAVRRIRPVAPAPQA